jgi:hypothetical protein
MRTDCTCSFSLFDCAEALDDDPAPVEPLAVEPVEPVEPVAEPVEPVALPPVELVEPGLAVPRVPPVLLDDEESTRPTISTWCPTWLRRSLV